MTEDEVEQVCTLFHDAYEAAAVGAGWETQERSRKPWAEVPEANKATMRATIRAVLASDWFAARLAAAREQAATEALAAAERAIITSMPHNWTLRHDGTEDPLAAAYEEGQRDACQIIASLGCKGCACVAEHDGDYGSSGHASPCDPHTCDALHAALPAAPEGSDR